MVTGSFLGGMQKGCIAAYLCASHHRKPLQGCPDVSIKQVC